MVPQTPDHGSPEFPSIHSLLLAAFKELTERWSAFVTFDIARVEETTTMLTTVSAWPTGHVESKIDLVTVRSFDGALPAICASRFALSETKAVSSESFSNWVRQLLETPELTEILLAMSGRALDAKMDSGSVDSFIEIGAIFADSRRNRYSAISLKGIGGFVNIATLERLCRHPEQPRSAFAFLHEGRYVATFPLQGSVKIVLTESQMRLVIAQAKKALSIGQTEP